MKPQPIPPRKFRKRVIYRDLAIMTLQQEITDIKRGLRAKAEQLRRLKRTAWTLMHRANPDYCAEANRRRRWLRQRMRDRRGDRLDAAPLPSDEIRRKNLGLVSLVK